MGNLRRCLTTPGKSRSHNAVVDRLLASAGRVAHLLAAGWALLGPKMWPTSRRDFGSMALVGVCLAVDSRERLESAPPFSARGERGPGG